MIKTADQFQQTRQPDPEEAASSPSSHQRRSALFCLVFAACLLVPSICAVSSQSLWTDEAISAFYAAHARIGHLDRFPGITGITNMPLYHLLLTPWVRLVGDSERALRSFNLPFAYLFLLAIVFLCRNATRPFRYLVPVLFSVFPLLIYYVNDARPYTALLGLSCAATVAFLKFLDRPSKLAAWLFCACIVGAIGMHLFGVLCPFALLLFLLLQANARRRVLESRRLWIAPVLAVIVIGIVASGGYLTGGGVQSAASFAAQNPDTPINRSAGWQNLAFASYEALGFSGIGPPRNAMRVHAGLTTFAPYLPLLAVGVGACILLVLLLWLGPASRAVKASRTLLASCAITLCLLTVAAHVMHFGYLGRHVMSVIGVVSCAIALVLTAVPATRFSKLAYGVLLATWLTSSARLLLVYPYGKDDIRMAVSTAQNTGLPILWNVPVVEPATGYYDVGDPNNHRMLWFDPAPVIKTDHWRFIVPVHRLVDGKASEIDLEANSLRPGNYVVVRGKADLADPSGFWERQFATMHPQLFRKLNGYDVFLVTVPSH